MDLLEDEAVQEPLGVSWPGKQGSISDCLGGPGRWRLQVGWQSGAQLSTVALVMCPVK